MNMIGAIKSLPDTRLVDCPDHVRTLRCRRSRSNSSLPHANSHDPGVTSTASIHVIVQPSTAAAR
jgi:hypothetical protein